MELATLWPTWLAIGSAADAAGGRAVIVAVAVAVSESAAVAVAAVVIAVAIVVYGSVAAFVAVVVVVVVAAGVGDGRCGKPGGVVSGPKSSNSSSLSSVAIRAMV